MAFSDELKSNNAILIAFKAHNHPALIVEKMVDEKNNLRPFYQFRNSIVHLIGDYDISLLEEEYSFAVRRAHLIASRGSRTTHTNDAHALLNQE